MRDVVLVAAARTPIGKAGKGALKDVRPEDLAATALTATLARAPGFDPARLDDVILGCATPELEQGMDIARIAALRAGLPDSVAGVSVNRFCASGLEAIAQAAARIATGQADAILAGGVESMSLVPFMGDTLRPSPKLNADRPEVYGYMGPSVEALAHEFDVTREASDALAARSQQRAAAAQAAGRFDEEIAPVTLSDGATLTRDEGVRPDTTAEGLAALKSAFASDGVITAGNASQRSDGAAAVLLITAELAAQLGLTPLARFVGYATAAVSPERFGIAPAYALPKLLERTGVGLDQVGLIEFNEAFAAQALASDALFPLPWERVNVNGGAIALGHPLGATGARQTVTLLHEARRRGVRYGIVTMCAALGMGAAALFDLEV